MAIYNVMRNTSYNRKQMTINSTYQYALYARPVGIGTVPKGFCAVLERPAAGHPFFEVARHGIVCYERELSAQEVKAFELPLLLDEPQYAQAVALLQTDLGSYARGYLEMAESEPDNFEHHLRDRLRALWPGHPPVVSEISMSVLKDKVMDGLRRAHTQVKAPVLVDGDACSREGEDVELSDGCKWFALLPTGVMVDLGRHKGFSDADEAVGEAIWVADEQTVRQWMTVFEAGLEGSAPTEVEAEGDMSCQPQG